ncbi:MAG TPA: MBL fold metallo-hydrolase [Myxococcales bacterium]|nr:MBL fold metallo-hydrolase [Myxococcales bacterium]
MRLCVLASGSGGNSLWVDAGPTRILIDCGLPLKETARRCRQAGLDVRDLTDVFLTHEHADHSHAAGILARKLEVRVHATRGTFRLLRDPPPPGQRCAVHAGVPVRLPGLTLTPLALPHDALEPVAYVVDDGAARAAIVTDLGSVPRALVRELQDLDALVLEMNHDVRMLLEGPYPWSLKQRIRGGHGHLSNDQGAKLLRSVLHRGLRHLVLAHLSEHNNTERHARKAAEQVLEDRGSDTRVCLGSPVRALDPLLLEPARGARPAKARQLALFA